MPQNAIISADAGGDVDYVDWIAWEAAEQSSDFGAVTVGIHRGAITQAARTTWAGTWVNGAEIRANGTGFLGETGTADSMTITGSNEVLRANTANKQIRLVGIEIFGNTVEVLNTRAAGGKILIDDCYIESSGTSTTVTNATAELELNNTVVNTAGRFIATTAGVVDVNSTTIFSDADGNPTTNFGTYTDTVIVNTGTNDAFGGSETQSNCASNDTTATAFPNITIADEFTNSDPVTSGDYTIKTGGDLADNGIGAFIQSGGISITEETVNTNYTSLDPTISLTGLISITENIVNTNYTSLDPTVTLTGTISIIEDIVNTNYTSLDPIIDLTGLVSITEDLVNTNYTSLDPVITLTAGIIAITEDVVNTNYQSLDPTILLTPEPIGILSTVCFDGSIERLVFDGFIKQLVFNGNIEAIEFNGKIINKEFNGSIQTLIFNGDVKQLVFNGTIATTC